MTSTAGPHLRIVASCYSCIHVKVTPSTASHQRFTECSHQGAPRWTLLENTHLANSTPQWCPLLKEALHEFLRSPQHKVNQ